MSNDEWIAEAMRLAELWAVAAYEIGRGSVVGLAATDAKIALRAHLAMRPSAPDGWVMVPVEPTDEMVESAWDSDAADYVGEHKRIWQVAVAYRAMIAAAPKQENQHG